MEPTATMRKLIASSERCEADRETASGATSRRGEPGLARTARRNGHEGALTPPPSPEARLR